MIKKSILICLLVLGYTIAGVTMADCTTPTSSGVRLIVVFNDQVHPGKKQLEDAYTDELSKVSVLNPFYVIRRFQEKGLIICTEPTDEAHLKQMMQGVEQLAVIDYVEVDQRMQPRKP
ncbi:hypothetical protein [Zooshikella harenae]|uniref:Inhibitor I9 domain-containing protein n=1 Tax=Zooshikella harenae TaxID=2827238 RepID=A0ABS5ZGL9_9GAMM|nr:hypothetical protein [Zooshikella harenae]MBU2712923.1 hypothetical protein [Zooshikella harenae]